MATAKNDVPLTLSVETVGLENIKALKSEVAALGKQGADAVPEFAKLGAEIDKLANQATLVSAFGQLSDEVDQLAAAQAQASDKSKELASSFDIQNAATDKLRTSEVALKGELVAAQRALFDKRQELARLKNGTADYADEARKLNAEIIAQKTSVRNLADSYRDAKVETAGAAAKESELATQLKSSSAATTAASAKLSERNTALNATKTALDAAGLSTANFAAAEADLVAAHSKLTSEVTSTAQALNTLKANTAEMAEADRLLAIEQRGLAELFEKGRIALIAEETAFREAARASAAYTAATEAAKAATAAAEDKWQKEAFAIVESVQAKERNTIATRNLIEAQNFLIAQDADAKWQKEAFAIVEATEAAQKLKRETELLAEAEQFLANETLQATDALKKIDDAAKEAGDGIALALGTVGVRSATEIRLEIDRVKSALDLLKTSGTLVGSELDAAFAKGGSKIKALERDLREATGQMTLADKAARAFSGAMGQFTVANLASEAVMSLVNRVQELGRAFIGAVVQGDSMRRGLTAVYKDAGVAAQQIDFLRKTAMDSGVAVGGLSTEFVKFSASMNSANIPLAQSNALFAAVTRASASLGIGTEATAGALNALGQMASKGTVSMEELRQQLGDRLPGALGLAAKGMGITEGQLVALVSSGQLATRDFIGPFTEALKTMAGETDGLINTWDRLKSALTTTAQSAGDTGWTALLTVALKALGVAVGLVVLPLTALSELIFGIAKAGGVLAAAVVTWTSPWQALGQIFSDAAERQGKLTDTFDAAIGIGGQAAEATTKHAAALTTTTAETVKAINANTALNAEQKLLALSTALAADKTLDAAAKIVQYNAAARDLIDKQAQQTDAFAKLAKAAKEQGDTMVATAKLTGDATVIQAASTKAAELHAVALEKVLVSGEAELAMLVAQRAELVANAIGRDGNTNAVKGQVAGLDELIVKGRAEVEQSNQASAAAAQQVIERKLLSETLKDNSSRMGEYKLAMEAAKAEIESLRAAEARGYDVKVGLANANERLAVSTALYKDAVKDSIANTELDTKVKSANLQLNIAQATASQNHYTAMALEARASGDVAMAVYYEIEAKKDSIRILKLKLELDKLQQEADLLVIETKRKLYEADTEENRIKNLQLDIEKKMIEVRQTGNLAVLDQIRALENEATALRDGKGARDAAGKSIDDDTTRRGVNIIAIDKTTEALKRELEARLKAAGEAATAEYNSLPEQLKRKGVDGKLTSKDLADAQNNFDAAKNNLTQIQNAPGGTVGLAGIQDAMKRYNEARDTLDRTKFLDGVDKKAEADKKKAEDAAKAKADAEQAERDRVKTPAEKARASLGSELKSAIEKKSADDFEKTPEGQALRKQIDVVSGAPTPTIAAATTSPSNPYGSTYKTGAESFAEAQAKNATASVVNITIGGVSTPVNVASDADARNLQAVLTQLANAQGRSI